MWERIIDRFTAIITNLMQENYELKKQLKDKDDIIARMAASRRTAHESQQ